MDRLQLPETPISRVIDGLLTKIGRTVNWIWLILLLVIVTNVGLRYLFGEGRVELEEFQWHLNAIGFLFAIAYAYRTDSHIRIDLISSKQRPRVQAWIELYGTLLLLLPFVIMVLIFCIPFVEHSFRYSEISQSPGGLPYRWFLKAMLPIALGLLLLGMVSRITRLWRFLTVDTQPGDGLVDRRSDVSS